MRIWSPQLILLTHKKHLFSLLCSFKPCKQFLFSWSTEWNHTHHLSVKSQRSAFAQWPEGEKWQRDDMETESRWQQEGATAPTGAPPPLLTPPKSQKPRSDLHQKDTQRPINPLPLPGGFVPGMGEGSREGNYSSFPFDPPPSTGRPLAQGVKMGEKGMFS